MEEWLALEDNTDNYWVYDTDGWVYWSSPIASNTATGLLLDEISLKGVMDDSYYYAINVVGQFITADDLGKDDNTGFYADGETVSDNALTLLKKIGVDVGDITADDDNNGGEEATVTKIEDYLRTTPGDLYNRYNYYTDHEPDFSKVTLLVTYDNGDTEQISATEEGVTFTPKDKALLSGQDTYESFYIYIATYKGVSCEVTILAMREGGPGTLPSGVYHEI